MARNKIFSLSRSRRSSRKRYLRRSSSSSSPFPESKISNGSVSASLKILNSVASNSISPVLILLFTLFSSRATTSPVTEITYSYLSFSANAKSATFSGLKTTCVIPYRSRRSINTRFPNFRRLFTHPAKVTVDPTDFLVSSPQVCVRYDIQFFTKITLQSYQNKIYKSILDFSVLPYC